MELLRRHLAGHIIAISIKFDSKSVAREHGDIAHHEHGRSVLLSAPRERELRLHHGRGNGQGRAVDCTSIHRLQFAVVALFIPADKMVAVTRSCGRGNSLLL